MYGHTPRLCQPLSWKWKHRVSYSTTYVFFMRGKHLQNLQDYSITVTGACTVRASDGASLPGSAYRALTVICRKLGLTGHFLHHALHSSCFPQSASPNKGSFFSGELRRRSSYLFQGQSALVWLTLWGVLAFTGLQQLDLSISSNWTGLQSLCAEAILHITQACIPE